MQILFFLKPQKQKKIMNRVRTSYTYSNVHGALLNSNFGLKKPKFSNNV
jgi:hypothetical protein